MSYSHYTRPFDLVPILFVTSRELVYNRNQQSKGEEKRVLSIGQVVEGRYRIVSEGAGRGIGAEYKAYDMQHDRLVVLLLLECRFGGEAEVVERLMLAAQRVADLALPALIPFEHAGLVDGQPYLVRAQVEGQTLAERLARTGPLPIEAAVRITIHLCELLAPMHRAGLVHGGLSPDCVYITDEGQITVTDAGLLVALRPDFAPPGQPWGRFPYLSPEQAAGEEVHPASDVYVVGSLLYELLTGRPPFRGNSETVLAVQHLHQEPPTLQVLRPDIPLPLAQIVHKALAKEPAARYRHAGQLAHILQTQLAPWLTGPVPSAVASTRPAPAVRPPAPQPAQARDLGPEAGYWLEEPEGMDWFMIALIIAALAAVLGLIPLWRAVYRRYSAPQSSPAAVLYRLPGNDVGAGRGAMEEGAGPEYHLTASSGEPGREGVASLLQVHHSGVQLTGWGSRLCYTDMVRSSGGRR